MKKVRVITRHAIANYGSLLQAIATQKIISELGYDCKIINYIRKDEYRNRGLITTAKTKSYVKKCPPLLLAYFAARVFENTSATKKFESMRNKWLPMTDLIHDFDSIPEADVYMTGSDQVWGPLMNNDYDWNYFLEFVPDDKKKVAFSSSFGKMDIDDVTKEKMMKLFKRYDAIAVRESHGVQLLKENGIESEQVLDPTLVMTGDQWRILVDAGERSDKGQYVLIYQIHNNEKLSLYAQEYAKKMGLPLVRVAMMHHQKAWGGNFVETPDIKDFIEYIDNAACVVTDSFHGTAFSINLNTPFVTLMPETGTSARNISLLELTNLESQIVKDINDFSVLGKEVDFTEANAILDEERIKSVNILKKVLS